MTRDDIIRMAREAGGTAVEHCIVLTYGEASRFAVLVAAAEREACARIVENYCGAWDDDGFALAATIRARGQA